MNRRELLTGATALAGSTVLPAAGPALAAGVDLGVGASTVHMFVRLSFEQAVALGLIEPNALTNLKITGSVTV